MHELLDCLSGEELRDLERLAYARSRPHVAEASIRRFVILELAERSLEGARLSPLGKRILKEIRPCARPS